MSVWRSNNLNLNNRCSILEPDEKKRLAELEDDVTLSLVDGRYLNKNKKLKSTRWVSVLYDPELEESGGSSNEENICLGDDTSSGSENSL